MTSVDAEQRIGEWIRALMRDGRGPLVLRRGGAPLPLRVVPVQTSAPNRPDGLRDDVTTDPGFSFAVSEAALQLDAPALEPQQLEAAHEVLLDAARDFDWIAYSHADGVDRAAIAAAPTLSLWFSSAAKGAGALVLLLEALGIPADEVST